MEILEEMELCILCNKPVPQFDVKTESQDCWNNDVATGSVQTSLPETETDLLPQLRVIFLLQQVFKYSLHDESILETMQALGNPSGWFEICEGCSALVDAGIDVLKKLRKYEEEHKRILEKLDRSYSSSFWSEADNIGENYNLGGNHGEDNSRRRKRSEFRNKIRRIGTACPVDDEIKHEPCDPTNVPVVDDEDWTSSTSCDNDFEYPSMSFSPPMESSEKEDLKNNDNQLNMRNLRPRKSTQEEKPQNRRNFNVRYNTRAQKANKNVSSLETNQSFSLPLVQLETPHIIHQEEEGKPIKKRKSTSQVKLGRPVGTTKRKIICEEEVEEAEEADYYESLRKDPNYHLCNRESDEVRELRRRRREEKLREQEEKRRERLERRRERLEKKNTNLQSRKGLKVYQKFAWFYENCHEYLDMSLVTYPPPAPTSEDQNSQVSSESNEKSSGVNWYLREEGFPCTTCDASFVNMFHTIAHIHSDHLGVEEPWKCNQCPYKDKFKSSFRFHVREHRGPLQTCKICNTFSTREQKYMDTHVINHQKRVTNPTCDECQQSFYNFQTYVEHMTNQHGLSYEQKKRPRKLKKMKPPAVCQFCNKAWPSSQTLKLKFHLFKVHNHGELDERFQVCSECGDVRISPASLEAHMVRCHAEKTEAVEKLFCEHCGKEYKLESDLKAHLKRAHHKDPQTCRICGVECRNPGKLRVHTVRLHSETLEMSPEELDEYILKKNEENPFECNLCKERFPFSNLLYHHYRTSHPEVTEKFKCDICGKGFSRQCSVKRHKESAHEEVKVTCEDCGKIYPTYDSLKQHQRHYCKARKEKEKGANTQQQQVHFVTHDSYDQQQLTFPSVLCKP